ncbi:MAG: sugar phosphate isomerase/epimerase [Planctomycetaceae bacterium]|nr:sugar phosphate isomerase/epimerase [Planctomycetaceae bacterium]
MQRRDFLKQAGGLAFGSAVALRGLPAARAIEPLQRPGVPKFKFSLAAYSYRDLLQDKSGAYTLDHFVRDCAQMQLEGTELTSYYFPPQVTDDELRRLKRLCFELGLDISGTAVGNNFCLPPGEQRAAEIADVKRWIDRAELLGAPVIRIFSGAAASGQAPAEAHRLAVAGMEECCAYAGEHGVCLALENHGGLTTTVEGMLALVKDVQSPWFGVNLDTGNFHSADIYADFAKVAPYTLNVQVKVSVKPEGQPRQPCDFKRVAQILRNSGYRGYVVLEYEEKEDPRQACPRLVDDMREAFLAQA